MTKLISSISKDLRKTNPSTNWLRQNHQYQTEQKDEIQGIGMRLNRGD